MIPGGYTKPDYAAWLLTEAAGADDTEAAAA